MTVRAIYEIMEPQIKRLVDSSYYSNQQNTANELHKAQDQQLSSPQKMISERYQPTACFAIARNLKAKLRISRV